MHHNNASTTLFNQPALASPEARSLSAVATALTTAFAVVHQPADTLQPLVPVPAIPQLLALAPTNPQLAPAPVNPVNLAPAAAAVEPQAVAAIVAPIPEISAVVTAQTLQAFATIASTATQALAAATQALATIATHQQAPPTRADQNSIELDDRGRYVARFEITLPTRARESGERANVPADANTTDGEGDDDSSSSFRPSSTSSSSGSMDTSSASGYRADGSAVGDEPASAPPASAPRSIPGPTVLAPGIRLISRRDLAARTNAFVQRIAQRAAVIAATNALNRDNPIYVGSDVGSPTGRNPVTPTPVAGPSRIRGGSSQPSQGFVSQQVPSKRAQEPAGPETPRKRMRREDSQAN